jgi:hypothetical protein
MKSRDLFALRPSAPASRDGASRPVEIPPFSSKSSGVFRCVGPGVWMHSESFLGRSS